MTLPYERPPAVIGSLKPIVDPHRHLSSRLRPTGTGWYLFVRPEGGRCGVTTVDEDLLRSIIRRKLADGRLPFKGVCTAKAGHRLEERCAACSFDIPPNETVVEIVASKGRIVSLHTDCFAIWNVEAAA
jgi:hypothetical protein